MIEAVMYLGDRAGGGHKRAIWPTEAMNQKSRKVHMEVLDRFLTVGDAKKYDVLCFHRSCTPDQYHRWEEYRRNTDCKLLYFVDGGVFDISKKGNADAYDFYTDEYLHYMLQMIKDADCVVLDNEEMKPRLVGLGVDERKMCVVLNGFPDCWDVTSLCKYKKITSAKPKILFSRASSYVLEDEWIEGLINNTKTKYDWVVQGAEVKKRIDGVQYSPYVSRTNDLMNVLYALSPDIGLCPKVDIPFNRYRGTTKGLEYAILGIPAIGTKHKGWKDSCCVMHSPMNHESWEKSIDRLVADKQLYANTVIDQGKLLNRRWLRTYYKTWEKMFCDAVKM